MKKGYYFTMFEFFNVQKRMSKEELLPKVRSNIHSLEKRIINEEEEEISFLRMWVARKLYYEAKKREILSSDEEEWCKNILFGKRKRKTELSNEEKTEGFQNILKGRRSIRSWKDSKVSNKKFRDLINAAKWAPSSCNRQPWHFIITKEEEKIDSLYKVKRQEFLKEAPYIILVLINKKSWSDKKSFEYFSGLDAGIAIQNLLLKAEELNLGTCIVNWKPSSISKDEEKEVREKFNIPSYLELMCIIPIGEYNEKPSPPGRKATDEILHFEDFKG